MESYMFRKHVARNQVVFEETQYLEISCYSDPSLDTIEESQLTMGEFENFIHQRGTFEPPPLPASVTQLSSVRLVLQQNAKHAETFSTNFISLRSDHYITMIEAWKLPCRAIDCSAATGVIFWSSLDDIEEDPHLQIIFRKADVRKEGYTRGWELFLSHEIKTGRTRGFRKGTPSSSIVECLQDFKAYISESVHPMFLPFLILSEELSYKTDLKHRDNRTWLLMIEHVVSSHADSRPRERGMTPLDLISEDINECYAHTVQRSPSA